MQKISHIYLASLMFINLIGFIAHPANADDMFQSSYTKPRKTSQDWDATIGLGAGFSPRYEGSEDHAFYPVPYFEIIWKDIVTLDPTGINVALIHNEKYDAGIGIAYDGGRDQKSNHNPFNTSDDTLNGMGNIYPSLGVRAFGSYNIEPFEFHSSATKFEGSQNTGLLISLGTSAALPVSKRFIITPKIDTSWADKNYMQTYFGVTPIQASRTQFSQFSSSAGFKDIAAGVNLTYILDDTQNWFISQDFVVTQLLGDTVKSPIVESNTGATLVTMLGYHF